MKAACIALVASALVARVAITGATEDEGMWTFDQPPVTLLQERYGFTPSTSWREHLQRASVRFNDGGSGSFVSADGLVLTNHHVALDQLEKISTPQKNYVADGFYAANDKDEIRSADLELNVLVSAEDVTKQVAAAVGPSMSDAQALDARRAAVARTGHDSLEHTGLRPDGGPAHQA